MIEKLTEYELMDYMNDLGKEVYLDSGVTLELYEDIINEGFRLCQHCDMWVDVDDQSGEVEIGGKTFFDMCDDCQDLVSSNFE